jgi:UDP:flavonoid glycosyltransferase YjiC (YdhE family)
MIEQWMTARNLERLRIGLGVTRAALRKQGCGDQLNNLLTDVAYKENAVGLATKYQDYDQQKTVSRLARTIERMAEGRQKQTEVSR